MKIIQVYQTNPFKEGQGGGVRYVKNLLGGIKGSIDEVLFLGLGEKEEAKDNIKLIPVTKDMTRYVKFLFSLMIKLPFMDLSKYDVVHVHRLYFAIPFILLKPRLKIVCSLHGRTFSVFESNNSSFKLKLVKPFFMMIEKFAIKHIDYLVPVSQDVINSFELKYKDFSKNNNLMVASPFIDNMDYHVINSKESKQYFNLDNKTTYLGFLGRLSDVKDINFLIELFSSKKNFFLTNNIKLVIFGDGELRNELEQIVKNDNLMNIIVFVGEVAPFDIDKVMGAIKILLISSKHESGPIVMKEAMMCGIPTISNEVGEVKDYIINGRNGYIVNKDYDSYFKAINSLLDSPLSKEEVINNSEEQLKKCSIEYVSNKYLKIYKELIND
ncbi:glycosyltransferase family 4 protein [bacterium]|jgi:glycosyltransferase involved in cell wall biosynthesis|nr:glycosyltransferase family 4 protein [bacterium]